MKCNHSVNRAISMGAILSLGLGVSATSSASHREHQFQHSEADHPWLVGIVINSLLAAIFVLPLSAISGRVAQRVAERRENESDDPRDNSSQEPAADVAPTDRTDD